MTEMDYVSARLDVLETVLRQLITHMAVRTEDPAGWVRTRRVLATRALDASSPEPLRQAALIRDAVARVFDQVELIAQEYAGPSVRAERNQSDYIRTGRTRADQPQAASAEA